MTGNVYEWTSTTDNSQQIICGGAFDLPFGDIGELYSIDNVMLTNKTDSTYNLGFRIVRSK